MAGDGKRTGLSLVLTGGILVMIGVVLFWWNPAGLLSGGSGGASGSGEGEGSGSAGGVGDGGDPSSTANSKSERVFKPSIEKGNRLLRSGDYEDSKLQFRRAIEEGSNVAEAYERLGAAHIATSDWEEAKESFLLAREHGREGVARLLASCYMKLENYEGVEVEARKALEFEPQSVNTHKILAIALMQQENWDEVLRITDNALGILEEEKDQAKILSLAYGAAAQAGQLEASAYYIRRSLEIAPEQRNAERLQQDLERIERLMAQRSGEP